MNIHMLTRVRRLFPDTPLTEPQTVRYNRRAWVRSIRFLGNKWRCHPQCEAPRPLEDAARYRHIRDVPHSEEVRSVLSLQQNAVMDKVIDKDRAAMAAKKGDTHE